MPTNTVKIDRTTRFGNRYVIGGNPVLHVDGQLYDVPDAETAVRLHREELEHWLRLRPQMVQDLLRPLRGKNVACWCREGQPCHGDNYLHFANQGGFFDSDVPNIVGD